MLEAAGATGNTDGIRLANQAEFAVQAVIVDGVSDDIATAQLANITSDHATVDAATEAVSGAINVGETFNLTKGLDNLVGTEANDTFNGSISTSAELNTLSSLDAVNGGNGVDTLKISTDTIATTAILTPSMSNVEVIEVTATLGANINTSAITDLTDLKIVKAGAGAITATAAATTNVTAAISEDNVGASTLANTIFGAKDVTVNATKMGTAAGTNADTIAVGTGGTAPVGDVVVNQTGAAYTAATADSTLSAIGVTGGKTISVTQVATSDASAAATDTGNNTITQGAVTIVAGATTTNVTVKQDTAVNKIDAVIAKAGTAGTQEITFTDMAKGAVASLAINGGTLTFTANKILTAAEAASAFVSLVAGDKQGNAAATLGVYSDGATIITADKFTSAATATVVDSTHSKVVFSTSLSTATAITNNGASVGVSSVGALVAAVDAVVAKTGVMGVTAGKVLIDDNAAHTLTSITLDSYGATSDIGTTALATTKLATLNLSNVAETVDLTVADTADTLALTLSNVGYDLNLNGTAVASDLTFTAAPKTLNVTSTGANNVKLVNTDNGLETLNVDGTGLLNLSAASVGSGLKTVTVTGTAGLTLEGSESANITSVTTTGTTGTVTTTIDATNATYTGGAGNDMVTIGTTATKAIDLGNGDNKLTLVGTVVVPTVEVKAGTGTKDTIAMAAASAASLTASDKLFADKISGFERLSVGTVATAATVKLENMDAINYVISNGTSGSTFTGAVTAATSGETFTFVYNGTLYTATLAGTAIGDFNTAINAAVDSKAVALGAGKVTATGAADLVLAADDLSNTLQGVAYNDTTGGTTIAVANVGILFDKMLANATVQLDKAGSVEAKLTTDTGLTDVVNVVTNGTTGANLGSFKANNIETINITANDTDLTKTGTVENVSTNTLAIDANKATLLKVDGAGNLTLTLSAATTEVATINASTMTGAITVTTNASDTGATTVTGGSANDTITLKGANDVAIGGDGNDTLIVSGSVASFVQLTGGNGIDTFDVSGFLAANSGAGAYITDLAVGETIKFNTAATNFVSSKITLDPNSTLEQYAQEAASVANTGNTSGIAWFQIGTGATAATYIVQDVSNNGVFDNGADTIIKINGLVDLSTASYSTTNGTLDIISL